MHSNTQLSLFTHSTAAPAIDDRLRQKLHPRRFSGMSGKMAGLIGYVLDVAYVEPSITELFVTSDRFLLARVGGDCAASTFLGAYSEFVRNWLQLLRAADLTPEEHIEAECKFAARVGIYGEVSA